MPFSLWLPGSLGPDLKFNYNNFVTLECLSFWLGFSRLTYISPPRSFVPALLCSVLQFVPLCDPGMRWERNELIIEGTDESTSAEKTRLLDRLHCGDEWVGLWPGRPFWRLNTAWDGRKKTGGDKEYSQVLRSSFCTQNCDL